MSTTRRTDNTDPAHAPERNLSSPRLRPINVSLALCAQAVRTYDTPTRNAALWLANLAANSQRIQLCWQRRRLPDPLGTVGRISEADLAQRLGLQPIEIYRALTGSEEADLPKFRRAVESFRAAFEKALPPLVRTADTGTIEEAFRMADDDHAIVELLGKWRHGKTEWLERQWLLNLHNTVWLDCPDNSDERTFIFAAASCLGIGTGGGIKPSQLRPKIKGALGIGLISRIVTDEAANLWPRDIANVKPIRYEYLRHLTDTLGVGNLLIITEQFSLAMELALETNTRWAPGQIMGRRAQYKLRDSHTPSEIRAIARLHAGGIEDAALDGLVAFAQAEEGYLGAMVKAIGIARSKAGHGATLTAAHISAATIQQGRDARIVAMAKAAVSPKPRRGTLSVVAGRRAA